MEVRHAAKHTGQPPTTKNCPATNVNSSENKKSSLIGKIDFFFFKLCVSTREYHTPHTPTIHHPHLHLANFSSYFRTLRAFITSFSKLCWFVMWLWYTFVLPHHWTPLNANNLSIFSISIVDCKSLRIVLCTAII